MPTYEYKCEACGHKFEKFQTMSAKPEKKCPACGKNKAKRLISAGAGLIFKGSGFYITDYRSKSYKDSAKSDSAASSTSTSTSTPTPAPTAAPAPAASTPAAKASKPSSKPAAAGAK